MGILPKLFPKNQQTVVENIERQLIRLESKIGSKLFGPVPTGHNREFFCLSEGVWIWHEDWIDEKGKRVYVSTRYVLRPEGILKSQNGQYYQKIDETEAKHLDKAIRMYVKQVGSEYNRLLTGQAA